MSPAGAYLNNTLSVTLSDISSQITISPYSQKVLIRTQIQTMSANFPFQEPVTEGLRVQET